MDFVRVKPDLETWMKGIRDLAKSEWSLDKDEILQLKEGLRRADLAEELDVIEELVTSRRHTDEPIKAAKVLASLWEVIDGPWPQLLGNETRRHETLKHCNASEVLEGFAFCAAGLRAEGQNARASVMLDPKMHLVNPNFEEIRRRELGVLYQGRRIKYILNVAGNDAQLKANKYPVDCVDVTGEYVGAWDLSKVPVPDDPEDDVVRLLNLPMRDNTDYDVEASPEVMMAARFIERAWRRHKRFLLARFRKHHGLSGGGGRGGVDVSKVDEKPPMILIHCMGGINRSPFVIIYWIMRFCSTKRSSMPHVWGRIKEKREVAFREHFERNEEVVLKDVGETWQVQLQARLQKERGKVKDMEHPCLHIRTLLDNVRGAFCVKAPDPGEHGERQERPLLVDYNCGGLPGSPILSDEEQDD